MWMEKQGRMIWAGESVPARYVFSICTERSEPFCLFMPREGDQLISSLRSAGKERATECTLHHRALAWCNGGERGVSFWLMRGFNA
jgi:hypothetical protein